MCSVPGLRRSPGGGHGSHSHILSWKISWTEELGELQFIGLQSQTLLKQFSMQAYINFTRRSVYFAHCKKLCKHCISTNWAFGATVQRASPRVTLFQQSLLTLQTVSRSASLTLFHTLSLFSCLQWWPMLSDALCSHWTCFGVPGTSIIWVNLADDVCVLTAPQTAPSPLSPSPQAFLLPGTPQYWN